MVLYRVPVQLLGKICRHLRITDNRLSALAIAALICVDYERLLHIVTPRCVLCSVSVMFAPFKYKLG